ncbi:hypothetical protein ACN38_g4785 [Penicillium nordicum]|uniref:Uncharacterized protein n=1 Tax=Penicillium nordicum TaxID=229535 RepID=A0A0M9WGU0_9EURO|nr:hypothetical protein ACN38_g4785 [Penicillium nordicum]
MSETPMWGLRPPQHIRHAKCAWEYGISPDMPGLSLEPTLFKGTLDEAKFIEFPLAHFAAMHWFHHYSTSREGKISIEPLVSKLFKDELKAFVT